MRESGFLKIIFCILVLIIFSFASNAWTQVTGKVWKPLPLRTQEQKNAGMPGGEGMQVIYSMSYAPSNPNIAYFVSDTSGVWRGKWKQSGELPGYPAFEGFFWESRRNGYRAMGGISLVVDPSNENVVFVSGSRISDSVSHLVDGIYRTLDGGESWELVRSTIYHIGREGQHFVFDPRGSDIVCDLPDAKCQHKTIYAATHEDGLLKSINGGNSWQLVPGLEGKRILDIEINVDTQNNSLILYIATNDTSESGNGLYKVIDNGIDPAIISTLGDLPDYPRTIALNPRSTPGNDIIYAAAGASKVYKSTNGGQNFSEKSAGLPNIHDGYCDPTPVDINEKEYKMIDISLADPDSDYLYVLVDSWCKIQPFYSHNGGDTWQQTAEIDVGGLSLMAGSGQVSSWTTNTATHPSDPNIALHYFGWDLSITDDGGSTWSYSQNGYMGGRTASIYFDPFNPDRKIFFLTDTGPVLSEDNGDTWRLLMKKAEYSRSTPVGVVVPGNPDRIITAKGGWDSQYIAISDNNGDNWTIFDGRVPEGQCYYDGQENCYTSPEIEGNFLFMQVHPQDSQYIYAGGKNESWFSKDGGDTWGSWAGGVWQGNQKLQDMSIRAIYPGNGDIVYAFQNCPGCSTAGCDANSNFQSVLWRSTNRGASWTALNCFDIGITGINGVDIDPADPNRLYVASYREFHIYDGTSWSETGQTGGMQAEDFGNGSIISVHSVAVDPINPNIVYAGMSSGDGHRKEIIYRSIDNGITWQNIEGALGGDSNVWGLSIESGNGAGILHMCTDHGNYVLCTKDNDNDGYNIDGGTCGPVDHDDNDDAVYPGAPEICDGKDNNGDGTIDEDADGDGYGCNDGVNKDCDNTDATIYPGAPEICDGKDNNCDGNIDEADGDGDGYTACADDCNDSDANVNPGATEICGDGIDNNCDGIEALCSPSNWYNDGIGGKWQYRELISISQGMTTANLNNFPVLIKITDSGNSVFTKAKTNGDDIVFTNSSGLKLDHEIEKFDPETRNLVAWVKLDLSSSGNAIYMYYGNEDINLPSQQNKEGVWDSNYVMVQHLSETSGQHSDSTSYNNDSCVKDQSGTCISSGVNVTKQGFVEIENTQMKAKIGGADEFDAFDDYINIPGGGPIDIAGNGSYTLSAWIYARGPGEEPEEEGGIINKGYKLLSDAPNCENSNKGDITIRGSGDDFCGTANDITPYEWDYVVYVYDSAIPKKGYIYINSNLDASQAWDRVDSNSTDLRIGEWAGRTFDGFIDEVRISNTARSPEWIQAEYNNQNNPGSYITFATQELFCTDHDGDGYAAEGGACGAVDCNDSNATIHPGANDSNCNGVDENCSGLADEGYVSTPASCGVGECVRTGELTCQNGQQVNTCSPGTPQTEICDGLDNNCDGSADNGLTAPPLNDLQAGVCTGSVKTCTGAGGWVNNYSGVPNYEIVEITCDTLNNDCDGQTDEGLQYTYYRDADGDGYGTSAVIIQACSVPSGYVTNSTDCNDSNAAINPGAADVCDSIDNNCNGTVNDGVSCSLTWNGSISTDWGTAGNWNLTQVPDPDDDVTIPNVTRKPVLDTARTVKSLTIQSGSSLSLNGKDLTVTGNVTNSGTFNASIGASVITVGGDWNFSGTFTPGTSTVKFISPSDISTITGSKTYYNMIFDTVSSDKTVTIATGTTITVTGTLTISGNYAVILNTGTITAQGNIIVANTSSSGGGTATLNITGTTNQTLTGSGTTGMGKLPKVTISKTGGILTLSSVISVANNWTYTRGTVNATANDSTVAFYGSTYNLDGQGSSSTMSFDNVIFGGTTTTLAGALDVDGNITINSNSTLKASSYSITDAGNWINNGTFTCGTGTVTFDGTVASVISGSTTFYNFKALTPNKTLIFTRGTTQTVANNLTLKGQAVNTRIVINDTGTGNTPKLILQTNASQAVQYVNVTNNEASSVKHITATYSICGGTCLNWNFQ
jgi:hypothetical protein